MSLLALFTDVNSVAYL